jgi:glyoxylase-like metal-dependent hydrolase (beta-lactamase superfamily II)
VIIIESQATGPFFKNGFVVACPDTRQGIVIDPGDEVEGLLAFVRDRGIEIGWILLTHAHVDHVTGVAAAKEALGVPVCLHRDDLFLYEQAVSQGKLFGLRVYPPPPVDRFYAPVDQFVFGRWQARPLHTPGHCPGGVCLEVTPVDAASSAADGSHRELFVGDTLFAGSIGRTDLPGGDYATLIGSIRRVLFPLGDAARVYPGHGPVTTIGHERRTNPFLNRE